MRSPRVEKIRDKKRRNEQKYPHCTSFSIRISTT